jgi:hypothetical protein
VGELRTAAQDSTAVAVGMFGIYVQKPTKAETETRVKKKKCKSAVKLVSVLVGNIYIGLNLRLNTRGLARHTASQKLATTRCTYRWRLSSTMPSNRISRILATSSGGRSSHVAICVL